MSQFEQPSLDSLPEHLLPWADSDEIGAAGREAYRAASATLVRRTLAEQMSNETSFVELGCGTGELYDQLDLDETIPYVQVDRNGGYLGVNKYLHPDAQLVRSDVDNLPFDADSLDMVLGMNVLDVALDTVPKLREVARIMRPGGKLIQFHDRRAFIPFLIANISEDTIPFAWVKDERMEGFQMLAKSVFDAEPVSSLGNYARAIRHDPYALEKARSFMPGIVDLQSSIVAERYGRQVARLSFGEAYLSICRRLLASAGLEVEMAETQHVETQLSPAQVRAAERYLNIRCDGRNRLKKSASGSWHFSDSTLIAGQSDGVTLDFTLNTIVARKPAV